MTSQAFWIMDRPPSRKSLGWYRHSMNFCTPPQTCTNRHDRDPHKAPPKTRSREIALDAVADAVLCRAMPYNAVHGSQRVSRLRLWETIQIALFGIWNNQEFTGVGPIKCTGWRKNLFLGLALLKFTSEWLSTTLKLRIWPKMSFCSFQPYELNGTRWDY